MQDIPWPLLRDEGVLVRTVRSLIGYARFKLRPLHHGKHVFVEKPLGLTEEEVLEVIDVAATTGRALN